MILADKIIKLRKKMGWSQEELAERMNVSRQAVSKWEGAQSTPDLDRILQLSSLFGVSTDYLLKDGTSCSQERYATLSDGEKEGARLRFYYLPNSHELYIGGTGSGKTTGCVEPQLRAIAKQKNKPNLFLTDPKGELFDRNAQHLVDQGYRLFVLNFKLFDSTLRHKKLRFKRLYLSLCADTLRAIVKRAKDSRVSL